MRIAGMIVLGLLAGCMPPSQGGSDYYYYQQQPVLHHLDRHRWCCPSWLSRQHWRHWPKCRLPGQLKRQLRQNRRYHPLSYH